MSRSSFLLAAALLSGLALTVPAQAHPRLIASAPANGGTVSNVNSIRLRFSERLVSQFSRAELFMMGKPGMPNHRPMKVPGRVAVLKDGRTMAIATPNKLQPGNYRLAWHAVSTDTHRVEGQLNFAVR